MKSTMKIKHYIFIITAILAGFILAICMLSGIAFAILRGIE